MIRIAASVCLLALAVLFGVSAYVVWHLPARIDAVITREAELTRAAVLGAITREGERLDVRLASIQGQTGREIRKTRDLANEQLALMVALADLHLAGIRRDTNMHLLAANQTLRGAALESLTLIPPARNVLDVMSENVDLLGRCEGNPDCFANRAIPALRAIEKVGDSSQRIAVSLETTTREMAAVAPTVAQDAAAVVADTRKITRRMASPFAWIWGGIKKIIPFP